MQHVKFSEPVEANDSTASNEHQSDAGISSSAVSNVQGNALEEHPRETARNHDTVIVAADVHLREGVNDDSGKSVIEILRGISCWNS